MHFFRRFSSSRTVAVSAAGTAVGFCLILASPVLLSGCGSGAGDVNVGGGSAVGVGRASVLLGTYKSASPAASGAVEETILEIAPGSAFETVVGSYSYRVLSARGDGKSDILSFESGKLAGSVLADGSLEVSFTPDTSAGEDRHRAAPGGTQRLTYTASGSTLTNTTTNVAFSRLQSAPVSATKPAVTLSGAWSGGTAPYTGFQLTNPVPNPVTNPGGDNPVPGTPLIGITLSYSPSGAVILSSPQFGSAASVGGKAHIYSQYDANIPANFAGLSSVSAGQYFVVGTGSLPASAPAISLPGVPIPVSLANREFLFEAGGGDDGSEKFQIGSLFVKLKSEEQVFAALVGAHTLPGTTSQYVQVGNFRVLNGTSVTPTPSPSPSPSPSPGAPAVGTIQFLNVSSPTNATTAKITDIDVSASFEKNPLSTDQNDKSILHATMTEKNGHATVERNLDMHFFAPNDAALAKDKVFTISDSAPTAAGQAQVTYIETAGQQRFWKALSGTATVIAHDSQHTTFRITAPMSPFNNAGTTNQPIGTFTIDAAGKF